MQDNEQQHIGPVMPEAVSATTEQYALVFKSEDGPEIKVGYDGTVDLNGLEPDEASRTFWEALASAIPEVRTRLIASAPQVERLRVGLREAVKFINGDIHNHDLMVAAMREAQGRTAYPKHPRSIAEVEPGARYRVRDNSDVDEGTEGVVMYSPSPTPLLPLYPDDSRDPWHVAPWELERCDGGAS